MEYTEEEYLMISGIQHFKFCRRQWALIHIEQQWADNYHTTAGELLHKRAHDSVSFERRGNILTARGLKISSSKLGLSGECDVVEFRLTEEKEGVNISGYQGLWKVKPVEYKKGSAKSGNEDELQLCAQAICLEEMFVTNIEVGYLFYGENRRRTEVFFSEALRKEVEKESIEMHQLFKRGYTPKVKVSSKCKACSLKEKCMPELDKCYSVSEYLRNRLGEGDESN